MGRCPDLLRSCRDAYERAPLRLKRVMLAKALDFFPEFSHGFILHFPIFELDDLRSGAMLKFAIKVSKRGC